MVLRKKRIIILSSVAALFALMILDISIRKAEMFEAFDVQFVNERRTGAFQESHQAFEARTERELIVKGAGIGEVELSSATGSIAVEPSPGEDIVLRYAVSASGTDEEAANRELGAVKVREVSAGGKLRFEVTSDGKSIGRGDGITIDYTLLLPDSKNLRVRSEFGPVRIQGVQGDIHAVSSRDLLEIVNVRGNLSVDSSFGSVYLSGISGNVRLDDESGEATVDGVEGDLAFRSRAGRIYASRIGGKVKGNAELGAVYLRDTDGPVELVGRVSDLQLEQIRGAVKVDADSGNTKVVLPADGGYTLDVTASAGSIRTHLPFPVERDPADGLKSRLQGVVGDGKWKVQLKAVAGDIVIHTGEVKP